MSYTDSDFDFWIKNNYNVLMKGKKGVGKTARILHHLERHGLSYKYFSAPTMDPWVDFIGVPKEVQIEGKSYLDLILPKSFADDEVEVIILDEYNRAPKKVRNAVMELIQFKSINGRPFKNLRFIWAAINPKEEEENYDVEELDPAQEDRFEVHIEFPYSLDKKYWSEKYGDDLYNLINSYWSELSSKVQLKVSPRRLDYAITAYQQGGNLKHFLPADANPSKLGTLLGKSYIFDKVDGAINSENLPVIRSLVKDPNNWNIIKPYILDKDSTAYSLAVYCLPDEIRNLEYSQIKDQDTRNNLCNNFLKYHGTEQGHTKESLLSFYYSLLNKSEIDILSELVPKESLEDTLDLNKKVSNLLNNYYSSPNTTAKKDALTLQCFEVMKILHNHLISPVKGVTELQDGYIRDKWNYMVAFALTFKCLHSRMLRYNTNSYKRFAQYKTLLEDITSFQAALVKRLEPVLDKTKYPYQVIRAGQTDGFRSALKGHVQSTFNVYSDFDELTHTYNGVTKCLRTIS